MKYYKKLEDFDGKEVSLTLDIKKLEDLKPLRKLYRQNQLKLNVSEIARTLDIDRRTVKNYLMRDDDIPNRRNRSSDIDQYFTYIESLLLNQNKRFIYISGLYKYLKKAKNITFSYSAFTHYVRKSKRLNELLNRKPIKKPAIPMNSLPGVYCELDWKENLPIVLKDGSTVLVNILVLILSHSRYRVVRMATSKSQTVLFHLLTEMFEELGGIPKILKCDNMKTIMDEARTINSPGVINKKFGQFAKDFGFTVNPCVAGRPNTKGRVEQPNRIFDDLLSYGGDLSLIELNKVIKEMAHDENDRMHQTYGLVPSTEFLVEKKSLKPLPKSEIRDYYMIKTVSRIVSDSSMVTYDNIKYSVPAKYIGEKVLVRCFDDLIHIYSSIPDFKMIHIHQKADSSHCQDRIIYDKDHLKSTIKSHDYSDEKADEIVDAYFNNLKALER